MTLEGFKPPISPFPPDLATEIRFETFFDREHPVVDGNMQEYTTGVHCMSTKQVPSALLLSKTGSSVLKKQIETVQRTGIPVNAYKLSDGVLNIIEYTRNPDNVDQVDGIQKKFDKEGNLLSEPVETHDLISMGLDLPKGYEFKMAYEDPFRIVAGRILAKQKHYEVMPKLLVWPGDGKTITSAIPGYIMATLPNWTGSSKNSIRFEKIIGQAKIDLLLTRTYWGRMLVDLQKKPGTTKSGGTHHGSNTAAVRQWAMVLQSRIEALLKGGPDPLWDPAKPVYPTSEKKSEMGRAIRFLELLKTVDGIFTQRYSAVPEEKWTWRKFDIFTLKNLSSLIGDEFFDGAVNEEFHDITTRYSELKTARKTFKKASNLDLLENLLKDKKESNRLVPSWLRWWLPIWRYTRAYEKPIQLTYVDSILSQTRGAGQPPELVKMQSKRKFLKTVSEETTPLSDTEKLVIRAAILEFDQGLDPDVFTGLDTKARITVNANACWEKTKQDGGTIDAVSEMVHLGTWGKAAVTRDLFSGEPDGKIYLKDTTPGTYIFWSCLDIVLKQSPADLRKAALVMISEPGKARTVTKASAALKMVLDVINKICSWPMGKISSSRSGMGKSSHAWNSFKSAWTAEGKEYVFNESSRSFEKRPDGSSIVTKRYRDLWSSSTDFEEATDSMHHEVALMLSNYWMSRCGIPPILQTIVRGTCYVPRPIVFEAYGPMASYGSEWTEESPFRSPRYVMLRKGILMGDPLTKVVLHLTNIVTRTIGASYAKADFIEKIFPFESEPILEYLKEYSKSDFVGLHVATTLPTIENLVSTVASSSGTSEDVQEAESVMQKILTAVQKGQISSKTIDANCHGGSNLSKFEIPKKVKLQMSEVKLKREDEKTPNVASLKLNFNFSNSTPQVQHLERDLTLPTFQEKPMTSRAMSIKSIEIAHALQRYSNIAEEKRNFLQEVEEKKRLEKRMSNWTAGPSFKSLSGKKYSDKI